MDDVILFPNYRHLILWDNYTCGRIYHVWCFEKKGYNAVCFKIISFIFLQARIIEDNDALNFNFIFLYYIEL